MRFSTIILLYFVIGVVMFGGGAIDWSESGAATWFVDYEDGVMDASNNAEGELSGLKGAITAIVNAVAGPILLIYNLVVGLLTFIHWPIIVLSSNNAPPAVIALLGGAFQVGFYMSFIRLLRVSA